ncbi:MAG: hypothetical protein ABI639_14470 [Thermoanaerobaculia bacterium]
MTNIIAPPAVTVEDLNERFWSNDAAIEDAAVAALNELLGADVVELAGDIGISRRELNKQRERGRKLWLARISQLARRVAVRFGPERTAAAARLFARASGHELAVAISPGAQRGESTSAIALLTRAMREVNDAAAKYADRAIDGIDRQDACALLPEFDQALDYLQGIRSGLVALTVGESSTT